MMITITRETAAGIRNDFHHKITHRLANDNQVVCIEDLNVKGMMKNHRLALTGDEFEAAQTMMYDNSWNPEAPYHVEKRIDNMKANAERLKTVCGDGWKLLPNHNGTPLSTEYLDDYIGLADAIYAGTASIEDKLNHRFVEMDPKAPELCRVRHGHCSIFIKKAEVLKIYGK